MSSQKSIILINPFTKQPHQVDREVIGMSVMGLLLLVVFWLASKGKKNKKLTKARFANNKDKLNAVDFFYRCLKATKQGKPYPSALWCGTPKYQYNYLPIPDIWKAKLQVIRHGTLPTLYLPDIGRGWLVVGSPGSGKTFSSIDPAIHSAFVQGIAVNLYDKKGDQMKIHTSLASLYGYRVFVYAPGESYSCIINPLDFMRDYTDSTIASELAKLITKVAGGTAKGGGDEFFAKTGALLAQGLMQAAKFSRYPDLAMVYAISQLSDLHVRINYAMSRTGDDKLDPWLAVPFSNFISSSGSEKTAASIKTTAEILFTPLIQKSLLPCLIGKTNIPLYQKKKTLVVFKLEDSQRATLAPLILMCHHLSVVTNLKEKRTGHGPYFYSMDELASLGQYDTLPEKLNEYRSNGGIPLIGIQNLPQVRDSYGNDRAESLLSALKTRTYFDTNHPPTNREISEKIGKTEVWLETVSRSYNNGQNLGSSRSISKQVHMIPLIPEDEIARFPQGKCIVLNPRYGDSKDVSRPLLLTIPIPQKDADLYDRCEHEIWSKKIMPALVSRAKNENNFSGDSDDKPISLLQLTTQEDWQTRELRKRQMAAEELFPLPPQTEND